MSRSERRKPGHRGTAVLGFSWCLLAVTSCGLESQPNQEVVHMADKNAGETDSQSPNDTLASEDQKPRLEDRPEYAHLREFKKKHQWDLMRRYNAHGLGVGRKRVGGEKTEDLALIFYVESKSAETQIPETFSFLPEGEEQAVELLTDVVVTEMAQLEDDDS